MKRSPLITIVMPVWNAQKTVIQAVESILNQTYTNFEFLIFDDCSTDNTGHLLKNINDSRIKIFRNKANKRVAWCMNHAIKIAKGKYLARMDADDISLPERLDKQVTFLETHQKVGVCGSFMTLLGDMEGKLWTVPTDSKQIKADSLFYNPIFQPTTMFRLSLFKKYQLFYESKFDVNEQKCEDYSLWVRCLNYFDFANLDEVLVKYFVTRAKIKHDLTHVTMPTQIRRQLLQHLFVNQEEFPLHEQIATGRINRKKLVEYETWLNKLFEANNESNYYDRYALRQAVQKQWYLIGIHHLKQVDFSNFSHLNLSQISKTMFLKQRYNLARITGLKLVSYYKQQLFK